MRFAIVGMACRYPDAASPAELWENVVAGRRAFRRLPGVRMRLEDYWDADPAAPDRFYARNAAVIEGYEFDRIGYKIAGSTYRSTDLTHWLALDTALRAVADAGFPMGDGLPRERTGVVVGNTLTGEFARANLMRLRWPYVRRTLTAALREEGWDDERLGRFLAEFETGYKRPFPPIDEDTLAGGLSNTIAGRICNYLDLNGGGYTVDGACSSSLLSVATSCRALLDGDIDVAIAGGVDLSIDPFEIIGFAKTGALARGEMRLYDKGSNGFWPGEGCGMVVLMREDDAVAAGHRIYATVAGWGISSDGKGGITRPEIPGYKLALRRAYERAGFGIETVGYFEGHGTGTKVGDLTELTALSEARTEAAGSAAAAKPAAVGSIKGMIGHTKAAAGVAGLIKATLAVHEQVLPPTTGCVDPHEVLTADGAALRMLRKAEPWPSGVPVRSAVTAMGFGGINTHVVIDAAAPRRRVFGTRLKTLASSVQDAELLLADGRTPEQLIERLDRLTAFVPGVSYAQLGDVAATLQKELADLPYRAAVVASSPEDATQKLTKIRDALGAGRTSLFSVEGGCFLGHATGPARVGYLFPGQGSGKGTGGGALRRRFAEVDEVYTAADLPTGGDMVATAVAQPRIVTGSMAGLRVLELLGVDAAVAVGHSLGELSALHWAGAMEEDTLLTVAATRGQAMTENSESGTMAGVATTGERAAALADGLPVVIAGYNGPEQTVVAGPVDAVLALGRRADAAGVTWTLLRVSHAFHSPLVAPAAEALGERLAGVGFAAPRGRIISTVTGGPLAPDTDVPALLRRQITDPVRFAPALEQAASEADLFIEVGPGRVLTGLAGNITDVPSIALDTDDESLAGLLRVAGAAYTAGVPIAHEALFDGRLVRPLEIGTEFSFLASPCEDAPEVWVRSEPAPAAAPGAPPLSSSLSSMARGAASTDISGGAGGGAEAGIDLIRRLAAERAELPLEMVGDDSRLLDDLHLSSITVGQIMNLVAQERLGTPAPPGMTNYATASVRELAEALDAMVSAGGGAAAGTPEIVAGAAAWARPFALDMDVVPLSSPAVPEGVGSWTVYTEGSPIAGPLREALEAAGVGSGVLVCLPPDCTEEQVSLALDGAKAALSGDRRGRFVLVQHGSGAAGLAKTLRLEAPHLRITIAHVPPVLEAVGWVAAEVAATASYAEVFYDADGTRRVPTLRAMPVETALVSESLGSEDVLLVTGGGKGITAECALALAGDAGAKLGVLGRSAPADDAELAANLARMTEAGLTVHYARADVTDAGQVRRAVAEVEGELGPVTAVLHGAGRNEPNGLAGLDMAAFGRTFAPKVGGLRAVLDAVEADRLRLLVTFGSIIGRAGLAGEAHYATANEWLADLTREFGDRHPGCRTLCMEWSVWSGVGMGERLSVVEALSRHGVTAITPEQGVAIMRRLVADPDAPDVVVISGRTEGVDTVRYDVPPLPLLRFVERPLIYYPGVELVTEVELNAGTDLYLPDHYLDGNLLFPAVFGMEAMTQVAVAATGWRGVPVIEGAEFVRPIVVPPSGGTTIRIAATVTADGTVETTIRSAETGFAAEHFRATLRFGDTAAPDGPPDQVPDDLPPVALDPAADLYGDVLFQGRRFQRLRRYHRAAARDVDADVAATDASDWFAGFLSGELLLGDPGMRDALMHGNQVCVPDATLLPTGIDRIHPGGTKLAAAGELRYCATERSHEGDSYVYDIAVRTGTGEVVERWERLHLQAVRKSDGKGPWAAPLLGPYLERTVEDLTGTRVAVAVEPRPQDEPDDEALRDIADIAVRRATLGEPPLISSLPAGTDRTSVSHGAGVTLCVAGAGAVSCHVAAVTTPDVARARMAAALACLREAGQEQEAPPTAPPAESGAWAVITAGSLRIATLVTTVRDAPDPVVFAILTEGRS